MSGDDLFTMVSEVYRNERRSKILTKLPINFFSRAEEYMDSQKEEYRQALLLPSNPKTMMLQDQIKKVEKRLAHIYEIRERKIALAALDGVSGSSAPENMTKKDKALFEHLVATLKSFREGSEPVEVPKPPPAKAEAKPAVKEAQAQIEAEEPEPEEKPDQKKETGIIVHVLEDIPSFTGTEHTYDLKKDDMVTLPQQFADLLSSKGKVRIIDG